MSFKTVSETGWPRVGKVAMGSGWDADPETWAVLTSVFCAMLPLIGESFRALDLAGLCVDGVEVPDDLSLSGPKDARPLEPVLIRCWLPCWDLHPAPPPFCCSPRLCAVKKLAILLGSGCFFLWRVMPEG